MAQLTADKSRKFKLHPAANGEQPMDAAITIYMGSMVGLNSSTHLARQLVAADSFLGFAFAQAWNVVDPRRPNLVGANGGLVGAAGAQSVEVREQGVLAVPLASVTGATGVANIGATVYASDGDTLTLTSTGNSKVGTIRNYLHGEFEIFFQAATAKVA